MPDKEKRKHTLSFWCKWLSPALLLSGAALYLFYAYPDKDIGPQQPIYFSHRIHAGVKEIHCRFCHTNVERSAHAGLPTVEKCFYCHKVIIPNHPQIAQEKWHYDTGTPVPWVRIYYVPDFVKFKHPPHINWGKLDCTVCHGDVAGMDRLRVVEFKMEFCINCHREKNAQLDCWLACHH